MHQSMEDRSSSLLKSHASAPGKVILFGEHGVVYGTLAIAASVSDLRIHVDVVSLFLPLFFSFAMFLLSFCFLLVMLTSSSSPLLNLSHH